jgi:hypothetical protein
MKRFLPVILLLLSASASGQSILKLEKDTMDVGMVIIEVDSSGHEFNSVYRSAEFYFKNTGNEPLIISMSSGSGNGFAEYPKEPILPGRTGTIKVTIYRFRYDKLMQPDGSHAFTTGIVVQGNFSGESKTLYVKGMTKKVRKK